MEMFELRYFLGVAQSENVHRASESLNVSTGSLSKAIGRLEEELGISLFYKQGRNIRLTPEGLALKIRAQSILQLEEATKLELSGHKGTLNVVISAEEILQSQFGVQLALKIRKLYPRTRFQFQSRSEGRVIKQIEEGEAHFALVTSDVPQNLKSKSWSKVEFKTCASAKHPLLKTYSKNAKIPVDEVLKHAFVSPDSAVLGRVSGSSLDGWRDDKFPRQLQYRTSSLKVMEELVVKGLALAYLPDYFIEGLGLVPLNVTGCPYRCQQSVKLICKDPETLSWLNRIWQDLSGS